MINHKKASIFFLTLLIISAFLCGCGSTVINNEADEIKLYSWEYTGEQGIFSELSFENDNAVLTIDRDGEHCEINGLCVFGEQSFVIIDNTLKNKFVFIYTLSGKYLRLEYNGSSIEFEKAEKREL